MSEFELINHDSCILLWFGRQNLLAPLRSLCLYPTLDNAECRVKHITAVDRAEMPKRAQKRKSCNALKIHLRIEALRLFSVVEKVENVQTETHSMGLSTIGFF